MVYRKFFISSLLASGLLLAALGSLRDVVTPWGYWGLWGVWMLAVMGATWLLPAPGARRPMPPVWVWGSCTALVLGMVLSAAVNHSALALHHAIKIAVIAACFWVAWWLAGGLGWRERVSMLRWVVAAVVLVFLASKAAPHGGYYIDLGTAGREGSFLAWPGVIWKVGAFFMPLLLADMLVRPHDWLVNGLTIAACVFLVVIDGTRTGLLVLGMTALAFLGFLVWRRDWSALSVARPAIIACVPALFGLLLLSTGVGYLTHSHSAVQAPPKMAGSGGVSVGKTEALVETAIDPLTTTHLGRGAIQAPPKMAGASDVFMGKAEALVETAIDPVSTTRLGHGDPERVKLLQNGIKRAVVCLPLGCGFGSTFMDPGYGVSMPVHNAYIGALADFGVLGLAGMLGFIVAAIVPIRRVLRDGMARPEDVYFVVASAGAALAYLASLMLHTFSSEMSEWGYLILMLAFAWLPGETCKVSISARA